MSNDNILNNLCQENNIVFFPENNSVTKSFSGNHGEKPYTNCISTKDVIDNSFKIDCFNFEEAEADKLQLFFITLAEQDRRISVPSHDKHCKRFFEILNKIMKAKDKETKIEWARRREINIKNNIHSHFWLMCKGIDSETVNNIWKKITGYDKASDCQEQYEAYGHRRYICKKDKNLEKSDKKLKRKFSYSKGFKGYLKKQEIKVMGYFGQRIATIEFSNSSVRVKFKKYKSGGIDYNFATWLNDFKKTLKFRTNDIYGFTALNEKENFINFLNYEEKIDSNVRMLYFISINGKFKIVDRFEFSLNKMIG